MASALRMVAVCVMLLPGAEARAQATAVEGTSIGASQSGDTRVDGDATGGENGRGPGSQPAAAPASRPEADRPFVRLLPNLFTDLGRIVSKRDNGVTLGLGALASVGVYPMDEHVTTHASAGGTDQMFHVAGIFGGGYLQAGGAVVTYVIGRVSGHTSTAHVGADLVRAQALSGFITHGTKLLMQRQRPAGTTGASATFSFPSAHASATWTSATVLWRHLGWKVGVPGALAAAFVSGARLQQNQHFLSDVVFGAAIGIAAGRTVTAGHVGRTPIVIAPVATAAGPAVLASIGLP